MTRRPAPMMLAACLWLAIACKSDDREGSPPGNGSGGAAAMAGSSPTTGGAGASAAGSGGDIAGAGAVGGSLAGAGGTPPELEDAGPDAEAQDDGGADAGEDDEPQALPQALRDLGVRALYPAPGSVDRCPDPALRIVFDAPPSLGASGWVRVFDHADPSRAVASIDLAQATSSTTVGGVTFEAERAAYVEGNELVVYPQPRMLERGHRYFVQIGAGALRASSGEDVTLSDDATWTFATRATAPTDLSRLTVAVDGSGDFCSPQGAIDATGAGPTEIELGRGTYHGIVAFRDKAQLTLRGADRKATILTGTNNENLNGGTAKRALIGIDDSSDIVIERLTIHNRTPQGGSQAEALRMQDCDRCIVRDADIISLQDTLLWSGRVYASNCYIAGNVDFIWGTGSAYFTGCEIKTVGRSGYTVQARNGADAFGYVFVDSRFTSDPGITGHWLARIDASVYPSSHVAYIDCQLGPHIDPAGWQVTGFGGSSLRFWEHNSTSPSGAPIDISQRHSSSRQLTSSEAAAMRDPSVVLGGWQPE